MLLPAIAYLLQSIIPLKSIYPANALPQPASSYMFFNFLETEPALKHIFNNSICLSLLFHWHKLPVDTTGWTILEGTGTKISPRRQSLISGVDQLPSSSRQPSIFKICQSAIIIPRPANDLAPDLFRRSCPY